MNFRRERGSARDEIDARPLGEIVDYILREFHRPLDQELPRIASLAAQVVRSHPEHEPLRRLLEVFSSLEAELQMHMQKEEQVLFPWITHGNPATAGAPIRCMETEHEAALAALARIRELTADFTLDDQAGPAWRELWQALEAFERAMHEHIRLENEVLFPRALRGDRVS